MVYKLRLYADYVGIIFGDADSLEIFDGNPIEPENLPITADLRKQITEVSDYLCDKYGYVTLEDWEKESEIKNKWPELVAELQRQLGNDFVVIDELGRD